jgi:hypothetical protein
MSPVLRLYGIFEKRWKTSLPSTMPRICKYFRRKAGELVDSRIETLFSSFEVYISVEGEALINSSCQRISSY